MDQEQFYMHFEALETRFEAWEPELCETVYDTDLGVEGYVVVWNTDISIGGPLERMGKGGTRITPRTTLDEIKMLSRIMALKNAAAGLPLGGAKSGMKADPDAPEFEKQYRRFVSLCKPLLFEHGGIFGGFGFDIGARPIHPLWACDELGSTRSFTGKPLDMGGTDYDKEGLAGLGVAIAAKTALEHDGKSADQASFAVQGAGAMGAAVIKYFSEHGGVLKAISDPLFGGSWFFDQGAPADLLASLSIGDFGTSKALIEQYGHNHEDDLSGGLYADVDVVFPCAVQDVIDMGNVQKIRARYVSEGANNPSSDKARSCLHENGVVVIPDFIANAGGVIAAFVELTSDVAPEDNVKNRINVMRAKDETIKRITDNVQRMMGLVRRLGIEPVHAGKFLALQNIFQHDKSE